MPYPLNGALGHASQSRRPQKLAAIDVTFRPLLVATLSAFLLTAAAACNASDPEETESLCQTLSECSTLEDISGALEGTLRASSSVADDSVLYVALSLQSFRFDPNLVEPDEVYVLSRHLETDASDDVWQIENLSQTPKTRSGVPKGTPSLAFDSQGELCALWGEIKPGLSGPDLLGEIAYARGRREAWSEPVVAYDAPPLARSSLSGGTLPASMAVGSGGRLYAAFEDQGETPSGTVKLMVLEGGAPWSIPEALFGGETTEPWLTTSAGGDLLIAYVDLDVENDAGNLNGLRFARSADAEAWSEPTLVFLPPDRNRVYDPRLLEAPDGRLHLVFEYNNDGEDGDSFPDQVWHTYSEDGGASWSEPQAINAGDRGDVMATEVALDGQGQPHAIYLQTPGFASPTGNRLKHAVWTGSRWRQEPVITRKAIYYTDGVALSLAADPQGCLHLVWDEIVNRGAEHPAQRTDLRYRQLGPSCGGS